MRQIRQKAIHSIVLSIILISGASNTVFSQAKPEAKYAKFLILVETTDDGLKLTCQEGGAWKELTFTLKNDNFQAIDQYGMTSLNGDKLAGDKNLTNFLFIIKKTTEGISLEGKEGTAWSNLSFSCVKKRCYQYIDCNGMIAKD